MAPPYFHPGPKRMAAALSLAGFKDTGSASPFGSEVRTMIGIGYAESSGNSWLVNHNTDKAQSTDFGLWQINNYWEGPMLFTYAFGYKSTLPNKDQFFYALRRLNWSWESYINNAKMAYLTYINWYAGPSFDPWTVYRNGAPALNDPNRVDWAKIDKGIARFKYERDYLKYPLERIASTYLETFPLEA